MELEPLNLRVHDWEGILPDCVKSEADLIVDKVRTWDCDIQEEVSVISSCHRRSPS